MVYCMLYVTDSVYECFIDQLSVIDKTMGCQVVKILKLVFLFLQTLQTLTLDFHNLAT